jgi:hypothetical protein
VKLPHPLSLLPYYLLHLTCFAFHFELLSEYMMQSVVNFVGTIVAYFDTFADEHTYMYHKACFNGVFDKGSIIG